ncbi:hypothetical protein RM863_35265 [Streptomyces sp. DSM 41014]|uniref:Uncharacterized protein n=1 Tax=Streptomyces hintoniae TaxID=3075521 RepID=A0ABU2UVS3_9ACTN|nr:hypothetical protein [Streptomyces sp. DSM 41014]MDT0477395.1 hypothetical protein [Streptomyces sp. DSM 41014]
MSKIQLVIKGAGGRLVPVGPDHPLPMTGAAPAITPGAAVADAPSGATTAQLRTTLNELLASLRAAGFIEESTGGA